MSFSSDGSRNYQDLQNNESCEVQDPISANGSPTFQSPIMKSPERIEALNQRATGEQRPTYIGLIKTPADAVILLSACDLPTPATPMPQEFIPPRRITRRLLDDERAVLIDSGSVFVWDEGEAGMRRWTDGRCWSASRVSGSFLTYRELEVRKKYVSIC